MTEIVLPHSSLSLIVLFSNEVWVGLYPNGIKLKVSGMNFSLYHVPLALKVQDQVID